MDLKSAVRNRDQISHMLINLHERIKKIELDTSVVIEDNIVDGVTTKAPSQNAVYDALLTKASLSDVTAMDNALQIQIDTKANIAGQIFTGNITAPNLSGVNTGDETTSSIQTKRPIKTIEGQSLEGVGDINLNKSDVDLGNVDDTSDLDKPISTATQTALNLKEDKFNKGIANGYAPLDANNKVPLSHINDALLGNVNYKGLWNQNTNTPTLSALAEAKGHYYICSGPTESTVFGLKFNTGDWIISNGVSWDKVDNTDSVSSVFGRTGNIVAQLGDYTTALVTETTNKNYQTDLQKLYNDATSSIQTQLNNKQATLVSGVNIRTINGNTLLGSTDLVIPIATDATTTTKGIVQLAGDLRGTAALPTIKSSVALTGIPTAPTAIVGTNTTQVATTAFVGSAVATSLSNVVTLTGSQTITGEKTFSTTSQPNLKAVVSGAGVAAASFTSNSSDGAAIYAVATGTNTRNLVALLNQGSLGVSGAFINMNNQTGSTNSDFITGTSNSSTIIYKVDKLGSTTATSFIKTNGLATEYLKADGSVSTLTNPVTGTGANGQVAFWNGTTTQTSDSGLFWDNTNKRVGIGTITPKGNLNIFTNTSGMTTDLVNQENGSISFGNNSVANTVPTIIGKSNTSPNGIGLNFIAATNNTNSSPDMSFDVRENDNTDFSTLTSPAFRFNRAGISLVDISRNGNFLIGTTTDDGVKLKIEGAIKPKVYTVATLPTATQGTYSTVSDALAPTYLVTVVGGGSVVTPVFYNGTTWVAH